MAAILISSDLKSQALRALDKLPPFSPTLNRLLAMLARDDVAYVKVADLIEKDAVLAGTVLALVNSAFYGRRGHVNSVRHAISLLGATKLKNAALSMSVTRMWNQTHTPAGWSTARFNQHAIAVAMLSDILSQEAEVEYPEGAFISGLLHDVGKLLVAVAMPDQYQTIERMAAAGETSRTQCEREVTGFTHAELSAEALRVWNLPEPIQTAVRYHHDPESGPGTAEAACSLSLVVWVADGYVNSLDLGINPRPILAPPPDLEPLKALNIPEALPRALEEFKREFEQVKAFF